MPGMATNTTTPPPTPASAPISGPQQASTGKSKYSRKFNAKWVATPPSSGRGSPALKVPSATTVVKPEMPSHPKRPTDESFESWSPNQEYRPSPPPAPVFQPNLSGLSKALKSPAKSPPYGGEANHKVPIGVNPSPVPTSALFPGMSLGSVVGNSHTVAPSEPNIRENPSEDWVSDSTSDNGDKTSPGIFRTLTGFVREKRTSKKFT